MKISWQYTTPKERYSKGKKRMEELFAKVAEPDTEVVPRYIKRFSPDLARFTYLTYLNSWDVIEGIVQSEKEGYDAGIIGCFGDPMLRETRQVVDIPVCAPAESSYLLASMLGHKFAVITVGSEYIPDMDLDLISYGLRSRAIDNPIRYLSRQKFLEWIEEWRSEDIIPQFEQLAKECVDDGAEVIIPGCTSLSALLASVSYHKVKGTEAPVLDCIAASIKLAETLVNMRKRLGISVSRVNLFKKIPNSLLKRVRTEYGLE